MNILNFDKVCERSYIAYHNLQKMLIDEELPEEGKILAEIIQDPNDLIDLMAFLDSLF